MRFVLTSPDFVYAMRPRPGFPLILDDEMEPAEPFHSYLMWRLLGNGVALDQKTWEAYGRALWDFARFLKANICTWNQPFTAPGNGVVAMYRDWQVTDLKLDAGTINQRLRQVVGFYEWAQRENLISTLPFLYENVTRRGIQHDLAHKTGGEETTAQANVLVPEWTVDPAFLIAGQLVAGRQEIRSTSQRLLWDLMARTGLRSVEARTFPLKYVFDPRSRSDLKPDCWIYTRLDPRDMEIKYDKPRDVAVPYTLMEDMWVYAMFERNLVAGKQDRRELILTINGNVFSNSSAGKIFAHLSRRLGFKVTALMLRHSYAIHTLLILRKHPELDIEPLMFLRDRLGHKNVVTTLIYLRQIERLVGEETIKLALEFDALYGITVALPISLPPPKSQLGKD